MPSSSCGLAFSCNYTVRVDTAELFKAPDGDGKLVALPTPETPGTITLAPGSPFQAFVPESVNVACFVNKGANLAKDLLAGVGTEVGSLIVLAASILVGCDISVKGDGFKHTCHYNPPDLAGTGIVNPVPLNKYGFQPCYFTNVPAVKSLTFQVSKAKAPHLMTGTVGDVGGYFDTIVVRAH